MTSTDETPAAAPGLSEDERLVLALGAALHRYGTPAHRIEALLERMSAQLGLRGAFFAVPTAILAGFGPLGGQRAGLVRLEQGGHDLGKLARLDELTCDLLAGDVEPAHALDGVERIMNEPDGWPEVSVLACYGAASASGVVFFGGGLTEALVAGVLGLLVGVVERTVSGGRGRFVFVPLAAALVSGFAEAGQAVLGPYRADVVTLAGLLVLLPGLTLTIALTELSTRHLVSGTARLTLAGLILVELGFGVGLGSRLGAAASTVAGASLATAPLWAEPLAVGVASASFLGLFRSRRQDALAIVAACFLAFYAARWGRLAFDPVVGAWVGAAALSVGCNLYARVIDRPPTVPLVPAILLLVPGSIGLRSVTWLMQDQTVKAVDAAFEMTSIGVALAVGLLMANVVLPPRRRLE